jgi:hypothetical protein
VVGPAPLDEIDMPAEEILLFVSKAEIASNDYLETIDFPASIRVREGMTLAEAKPIIREKLGIDEAVLTKSKFFTGAQWIAYTPSEALKDDFVVFDLRHEDTILVVTNTKRKPNRWHRLEEAVKIGN